MSHITQEQSAHMKNPHYFVNDNEGKHGPFYTRGAAQFVLDLQEKIAIERNNRLGHSKA